MRTSCISHRPKTPIVILSADYLELCDGDPAAAIILKILEYWTDIKLSHGSQTEIENQKRKQAGEEPLEHDLWIYKTGEAFQEDSLGLLKEHDVTRGLKVLLDKGFIERRNNPKFKWDRTWQYRINVELINDKLSIPYQCGMQSVQEDNQSGAGAEALPEITTETPIEIKESTTTPTYSGKCIDAVKAESIYREVTGFMSIPSLSREEATRMICDIALVKGTETTAYLKQFYTAWLDPKRRRKDGRTYSKLGTGWLDWASAGTIPDITVDLPKPQPPSKPTAQPVVDERAAALERFRNGGK
jgi:hypothetical protein